jgi:hypothetical protein
MLTKHFVRYQTDGRQQKAHHLSKQQHRQCRQYLISTAFVISAPRLTFTVKPIQCKKGTSMKNLSAFTKSVSVLTLISLIAIGGCASTPMPNEEMAVAESAVQRANTRSTSQSAPGELQIAIAKLASAKQALASKNLTLATQLAEEATIDAQVAELRAESVRSQTAAKESQDAAQVLRDEINRNSVR